jgi:hypothetical protein
VAIGLPFLEAFASRQAWAAPPKRFAIVFECNGVNMDKFWPTTYGPLTAASLMGTATEPLAAHASKLLIPRGLFMSPRGFALDKVPGCDHQKGTACKLTCAPLAAQGGYPTGPSIDQVIAKSINPGGKAPLNLGVGTGGQGPLSSAFYTTSNQPAPMQKNPWTAFKDWMGSGTMTGGMQVDYAALRRKSVLDVVRTELMSLKADPLLSASDKQKVDLHTTSLRQLESNMTTGGAAVTGCNLPSARTQEIMTMGGTAPYEKVGEYMMDIMAIAMACDYNRVCATQFGTGAGGPIYKWCGDKLNQQYNHHKLSHGATTDAATSANLPEAEYKLALFNIDQWHMKMMKILVDRLASYTEPGGTVLDNSVVMYTNELSHGLQHHFADLPVVIAGSGGGYLKQGQFIKMTSGGTGSVSECPMNQLFTTIANAVGFRNPDGAPMTNFGKATGSGKPGEYMQIKA